MSLNKVNFGLQYVYINQGFYSTAVTLDLQAPHPKKKKKKFSGQQIQAV